jgi:hypothetical protein
MPRPSSSIFGKNGENCAIGQTHRASREAARLGTRARLPRIFDLEVVEPQTLDSTGQLNLEKQPRRRHHAHAARGIRGLRACL